MPTRPKCLMTTHHSLMHPSENISDYDLLTVVVPVYNREHLVANTLDSIISGAVRYLHLVIVDNNSTDNTLQVLQEWKKEHENLSWLKTTVVTEKTPGAAAARNRGLREASTPWVMFFDSDDTMTPGHIPAIINQISETSSAQLLTWQIRIHLLGGEVIQTKPLSADILTSQLIHCPLATQNYAVRTDLIRAVGAWDDSILRWDDWELGVRLLLANPEIESVTTSGVDIFRQEDSMTGTSYFSKRGEWEKAIDKVSRLVRESDLKTDLKSVLLFAADYRRALLAAEYYRENHKKEAAALLKKATAHYSFRKKILLKWAFHHTRRGFRGAWTILKTLSLV